MGDRLIGPGEPCFIVAEAGINHNGNIEIAKELIEKAAQCGCDAIKFQTYITEQRVPRNNPIFDVLKKGEFGFNQYQELFKLASKSGILFFSTTFDEESTTLLINLGVSAVKIASFDIVNLKLLKHVAEKRIPMIVSTGMANLSEVKGAVEIIKQFNTPFSLLHCISAYPTKSKDANLRVIQSLQREFDCPVGYSDHTLGIQIPILAVAAGANILEKHFTLDKNMEGPDHKLSADPQELREMVNQIHNVEKILGRNEIKLYEAERSCLIFRRRSG